jgi:hypothetical protein
VQDVEISTKPQLTLSMLIGLPTNMTIRCLWFLFWRCLRASCAICTEAGKLHSGSTSMSVMQLSTLPRSGVGVTRTRGVLPAMLRTPTVFSGCACVLAPASKFTASACA